MVPRLPDLTGTHVSVPQNDPRARGQRGACRGAPRRRAVNGHKRRRHRSRARRHCDAAEAAGSPQSLVPATLQRSGAARARLGAIASWAHSSHVVVASRRLRGRWRRRRRPRLASLLVADGIVAAQELRKATNGVDDRPQPLRRRDGLERRHARVAHQA